MPSPTTAAAAATLQFIGIILFSRELAPNRELIALAPRITAHASHSAPLPAKTIVKRPKYETGPKVVDTVEEHAAFIAFPASDYLSNKGWPPLELAATGYKFVQLDGDHVTFRSEKRKTVSSTTYAGVSAVERRAVDQALDDNAMGLPHLRSCCPGAELKTQFRGPDFPGAVAVFRLPSLKVKGCKVNPQAVSRVDSRVTIENNGMLVIVATKDGLEKTIHLDGNATIIVAHMPVNIITGIQGGGGTAPHYQAYYDMIEQGSCSPDFFGCATLTQGLPESCNQSIMRERPIVVAGSEARSSKELPWVTNTDFECSNTQWP